MLITHIVKGEDFSRYDNDSDLTFDREDRNGTRYYTSHKCPKCGGTGYIDYYGYIAGGKCFRCGGSGRHGQSHKVMTEAYAKKLEDRRIAKARKEAPEKNARYFKKLGFSEDGTAYIVCGDTFAIKEELKAAGARFHGDIGWHFAAPVEGYDLVKISVKDKFDDGAALFYENYDGTVSLACTAEVKRLISEIKEKHEAESKAAAGIANDYFGEIGQRVTVMVKFVRLGWFETHFSYYGETVFVYTFEDDAGHVFVWKTGTGFDGGIENGAELKIKATIKEHSEYDGIKQTVITRCKKIA